MLTSKLHKTGKMRRPKREGVKVSAITHRHITAARLVMSIARRRLLATDPAELTVDQAAKYLELGVKVERLATGLDQRGPSVNVQNTVAVVWGGEEPAWLKPTPPLPPVVEKVLEGGGSGMGHEQSASDSDPEETSFVRSDVPSD